MREYTYMKEREILLNRNEEGRRSRCRVNEYILSKENGKNEGEKGG